MKKVKFIRNTVPEREGGEGWRKGDVVVMNDGSAARWMRRSAIEVLDTDVGAQHAAVQITPAPAPAPAPAEPAAAIVGTSVSEPVAAPASVAAPAPAPAPAPTSHRTTLSVPRKQGGNHRR